MGFFVWTRSNATYNTAMRYPRPKVLAWSTAAAGMLVLLSAGISFNEPIRVWWSDYQLDKRIARLIEELSHTLRAKPEDLLDRLERLLKENRELKGQVRGKSRVEQGSQLERCQIGDVLLVRGVYDSISGKGLREIYDGFKQESERLISTLVGRGEGKVQVLITVSPILVKEGWKAGEIFGAGADLLQARGGGRPEMVQAGGKAPEGAEQALQAFEKRVRGGP